MVWLIITRSCAVCSGSSSSRSYNNVCVSYVLCVDHCFEYIFFCCFFFTFSFLYLQKSQPNEIWRQVKTKINFLFELFHLGLVFSRVVETNISRCDYPCFLLISVCVCLPFIYFCFEIIDECDCVCFEQRKKRPQGFFV